MMTEKELLHRHALLVIERIEYRQTEIQNLLNDLKDTLDTIKEL